MFCMKTGRKLAAKRIDGQTLPCCDKTECKNWGKFCGLYKDLAIKIGACDPAKCSGDDCKCG